ncbi:MAG TPA: phosphonatase-like hydrolase [Cyclobacteriaceae bacterium]|nr:phosphonatase-like hydrolase [Cyclobacteriaceae bacterium]
MIKMIVFDMAGTVIDENNVVYKTLLEAISASGYDLTLDQVLEEGAGKEKFQAIKDIVRKRDDNADHEILMTIFKSFQSKLNDAYRALDIKAQPGAEQLFKELKQKGIYVVLNTGYDSTTAHSILEKVGWKEGKQIDAVITASDVINNRPQPDMIELAKKKLGLSDSDQIAKVGDSIIDIEEGKNAKCALTIGITTGAHSRDQLLTAKPNAIIGSLSEVMPLLKSKE